MLSSTTKKILKRTALVAGVLVAAGGTSAGVFAAVDGSAYDESMNKTYDVPLPGIVRSTDPAVIARGKHLVQSVAGCADKNCHGADLAGGTPIQLGPLGTAAAPNITPGNLGAAYGDGELARLIRHGIKRDGRSVLFMPVRDFRWFSDADVTAVVSYLRAVPPVDRPNEPSSVSALGKVLDRHDQVDLDIARRIDHGSFQQPPQPAPTAEYGRALANTCTGCHGDHLSGGHIPGTPPSMPTPRNLTPDATGLAGWTYDDFARALTQGVRKDGTKIDAFMPFEEFAGLDDVEKHALWEYVRGLPARPFGQR
jgi:hypothetical protein